MGTRRCQSKIALWFANFGLSVCPTRGSSFVEWCMRTQSYPSDLTDAQWRLIEPQLPVYPGGRPRATDLRDVVDAILYILRTGCQWRYIPKDFPPKSTVWKYFDQWRRNGTFETIHDLLRRKVRSEEKPYSPRTSASVDSQSVDTTSGGEQRGRDNAKNVDGRKRHIVVDSMGLLMAILVTAANIDDAKAAADLFVRLGGQPMSHVKTMYADTKYHNFILYEWVEKNVAWELSIVQRPKDAVGWVLLPIRWTVERTFAWLGKCRRLSKDREKSVLSSETFVRLAMIHLMLNRLQPKNVEAPFEYRAAA
jgi:putative transposase